MKNKLFHRSVLLPILLAVISFAVLAQQATTPTTPSIERLREHITYLASDKLEGRRTGSGGANMAAEYIAHEFSRYGLRRSIVRDLPGMSILEADSPRRYMQSFPYVAGVELGKRNQMTLRFVPNLLSKSVPLKNASSVSLKVGEDWMPLGLST